MDKRSEVFRQFSPKLLEAFMLLVLDEINILRNYADLPPRTKEQVHDMITNHFSDLPDYDEV